MNEMERLPDETPETPEAQKNSSFLREVYDWMDSIVVSAIVVVLIFTFLFRIVGIKGESMENTLFEGDKVIITDLFYKPHAGDIVVISRNLTNQAENETEDNEPIIKRVIATEGQTVDIDFQEGIVYVDGQSVYEEYVKEPTYEKKDIDFPVIVKPGCVFVLGDNRNHSLDSRSSEIGENGMIDERYILGRAVLRVYPFDKFGLLK